MGKLQFNIGGAIKNAKKVQINVDGAIKNAKKIQANIDGVIKTIWVLSNGIDEFTKLMLHMNGANGSTVFTDSSLSPKTVTANGNARLSTMSPKFGTASGLFDGAGDYIDTPDSEDFNVGNGNFTVDCWVKFNSVTGTPWIFGQGDASHAPATISTEMFLADGKLTIRGYQGSSFFGNTTTTVFTVDGLWHHIEACRSGNQFLIFVDGVSSGGVSDNLSGVSFNNSYNKFTIGRIGEYDGAYLNGYIDEFRFSKGIARHTANFTPPTSEYTT
jgi:hypothetical protein